MKRIYNFLIKDYSNKQVTKVMVFLLLTFGTFHTSIWFLYTKKILEPLDNEHVGELVRLTCQTNSLHLRKYDVTLEKKHTRNMDWDGKQVDILTIGDSFSDGGAGGKNPYYQDYIETIHNKKVLNILPLGNEFNYIETIIALYKNGLLDDMKPKVLILESIERLAISRFSTPVNWDYSLDKKYFLIKMKYKFNKQNKSLRTSQHKADYHQTDISIINKRNYDCILNPIYYKFSKYSLDRNYIAYKADLSQEMFSVNNPKKLLFLKYSIDNIRYETEHNINILNDNMNKLSDLLKTKNITLMFMPIVDKYNLYSPYIIDNTFSQNTFFENLEKQKKSYYFINTKKILRTIIGNTKDVFYADDSHWGFEASRHIVEQIPFNDYFEEKENK